MKKLLHLFLSIFVWSWITTIPVLYGGVYFLPYDKFGEFKYAIIGVLLLIFFVLIVSIHLIRYISGK